MWKLITDSYNFLNQAYEESLYMVGNGYIGVRGNFEEGYAVGDSIRGTYINGLYDRVPMIHAEMAYGFPTVQDKQPRILDTQTCQIILDGEQVLLVDGKYTDYHRALDFQSGESTRHYKYFTSQGKTAEISFKRLASLKHVNFLLYQIEVIYDGEIELISLCDTEIQNYANPNDPRTGQGHTKLMDLVSLIAVDQNVYALMRTHTTQIEQAVAIGHTILHTQYGTMEHEKNEGKLFTKIKGYGRIGLEKKCVFTDALRSTSPLETARDMLDYYSRKSYDVFLEEQKEYLDEFWYQSGIEIVGDTDAQLAVRLMQYQLLQSVGVDRFSNVAAKGLSGEGYEGHYFWDTEIYILPVLQLSQPSKAKALLSYRHRLLPFARERAKQLGHHKGAAFAWRTISGIECSGYFPAGTAQYHINSDIAYAFIQYYLYTQDLIFMAEKGFEVILETARLWLSIGHYVNGKFQIHDVTGPDEYTAIVNNNYYTNAMVKYHFYWTFKLFQLMEQSRSTTITHLFEDLKHRLDVQQVELNEMLIASENMFFPYDQTRGMFAQDDSFLNKPLWPKEIEYSKRPLLLHYHPLTIYRHQVIKQADTVLAHMLLEQYASESDIENGFNYYESVTTHDSSLSSCIYGIMASRVGQNEKAFEYFGESLMLDLKDTHKNTKDGLHMANMAGSILSVTAGFAGLRIDEDYLQFRPQKPASWEEFSFKLHYQDRLIKVTVGEEFKVNLLEGEELYIKVWDQVHLIEPEQPNYKAVVFDMDGVLTETSKAHYQAWVDLATELGFEVPETLEDEVRGISRMDSLEIVLGYGGLTDAYTEEEKEALATKKNEIYLSYISDYSPLNLAPGAFDLLMMLKTKKIKIALASASKNAPMLLKAMGIESFFDVVVDPSTIENGKPAPDIFLKAAELLRLSPKLCIGVEDAYAGIESITLAGMTPLGIGSKNVLSNCEMVFSGLDSLQHFLINHLL